MITTLPKSVGDSKSLEKLYLHCMTRGSEITADHYVVGVRKFAEWAKVAPEELIRRRKRNLWGAMINDYITDSVIAFVLNLFGGSAFYVELAYNSWLRQPNYSWMAIAKATVSSRTNGSVPIQAK
jgi:hypothetical protein